MLRSFHLQPPAIIAIFAVIAFLLLWQMNAGAGQFYAGGGASPALSIPTQTHRNIAVATSFGYHHDVLFALTWTLERAIKDSGQIGVYAPTPLSWHFQDVVDRLGLYHGEIQDFKNLLHHLKDNLTEDMVVLGTCEVDLRDYHNQLLAAWDARDAAHKFQLVCLVHNVQDYVWQKSIPDWSRRNAIRLVSISEHVAKSYRESLQERSYSSDPLLSSPELEYIPVDVHVQALDIPNLPQSSPTQFLSNVVIQGTFDYNRRSYNGIFAELIRSLHADPGSWGYLPLGNEKSFSTDKNIPYPPFRLHLVGSGNLQVPIQLKEMVVIHTHLNYTQFYDIMGGMDVCLPAFNVAGGYFAVQASSTIGTCLEVNVPILVTQRIRNTYTHVDDDRVVITRPVAMSEVEAIKALRTGNASAFLAGGPTRSGIPVGSHPRVSQAVEKMMQKGWARSREGFSAVKRRIWSENDVVAWRLLRDL